MKKTSLYYIFIVLIILSGCSASPTSVDIKEIAPIEEKAETPVGSYPAPVEEGSQDAQAYPAPVMTGDGQSTVQPTQDPALGQVKGKFLIEGKPSSGFVLYLAEVVKDDQGVEFVVNFNRDESYPSVPDADGNFMFVNVPAGRYGLVFDQIVTSYLMTHPRKGESLLITVEPGQTIDLGTLEYEAPPSP